MQYCSMNVKFTLACKNYIVAELKIKLILCHSMKAKLKNWKKQDTDS